MEIEEALGILKSNIHECEDSITVPLAEAYGHLIADDITASFPVPSFPRSAMDGYAVRADDVRGASSDSPVRLRVLGETDAGDKSDFSYVQNSAVRIMTGAMIPEGYDAVVKQEDTDYGETEVNIRSAIEPYTNYCKVGEEIKKGQIVCEAGRYIGTIETGLLASLGFDTVKVKRPMKVGIISTGSELAKPGEELQPGMIYGTIRYMLSAAVKKEGFTVSYSADCTDDAGLIRDMIREAVSVSDVVITTGGVSVGKKDLVVSALDDIGAKMLFSYVNIQPGTPTVAAVYDGRIILGLSGNPYAALANFDLYFPVISSAFTGNDRYMTQVCQAELADPYKKVNRMRRFVRAREESGKVYLPTSEHMSSVFGNMHECNCYIDVPAGTGLSVHDMVTIRRMRIR